MSSLPATTGSLVILPSIPNIDEKQWVDQIRRTLKEEPEPDIDVPVCIFSVPQTLMSTMPIAYIPQQVALGPYHCWRPELYQMDRYKHTAAKRIQKKLQNLKFDSLVEKLIKFDPKIRACYHKYLDISAETLAWMMAVDASFLIEFLETFSMKEGKNLTRVQSRISHLVDFAGTKSAYHAVLRDILLLENQIPLFLLHEIIALLYPSMESENKLSPMLIGLCNEISPFNEKDLHDIQVMDYVHLLDFLYQMIVPKPKQTCEISQIDEHHVFIENKDVSFARPGLVKQLFTEICRLLSKLNKGPVLYIKKALQSRPVKLVAKLPWTMISRIPGVGMLTKPVQHLFFKDDEKVEEGSTLRGENKAPLMEEIMIPSVTELFKSGVRFVATNKGITSIEFDVKKFTLHLPIVSLDVNTEILLRNLVAYEASSSSGPLVITRYTEFMNGIIDTEEDAKFLRERGIFLNRLKSDKEVADLWNGMNKSVKLTRVPFLDKVIEDVNKFHNKQWRVKFVKLVKIYVFGSWQCLTLLAAIFLLFLMTEQSVCSVYRCSRFIGINSEDLTKP